MTESIPYEFKGDANPRLKLKPMYYLMGNNPDSRVFVQRRVVDLILLALRALSPDYGLMIWDGYRSRACQAVMFEWMCSEVRRHYPYLSDAENFKKARKYMSPATVPGDPYCPPHLSGGALDLTLFSVESGNELDMGTPFDDCSNRARAMYFEEEGRPKTDAEIAIRDRRRVLRNAMTSAGFTAYEYEWWHFDYGNVFWARATGRPEIFGPLFGDGEPPLQPRTADTIL